MESLTLIGLFLTSEYFTLDNLSIPTQQLQELTMMWEINLVN